MPKQTTKARTKSHHDGGSSFVRQQLTATERQFAYRSDPRVTMKSQQMYPNDLDDLDCDPPSPLQIHHSRDPKKHHQSSDNHSGYSSTPTSLTNLAQLSGISLTPVATNLYQRRSTNRESITQHTTNQAKANQSRPRQNINRSNPWGVLDDEFSEPNSSMLDPQSSFNLSSTYNLATIPSIQLIDQTAMGTNDRKQSSGSAKQKPNQRLQQPKTYSNRNENPRNNLEHNGNQQNANSNPTHNIDNSSSTRNANMLNDYIKTNNSLGNIFSMAPELFGSNQQGTEMSEESNAEDLMKLVAIFNNPALTITPVTSLSKNSSVSNRYAGVPSSNLNVTSSDLSNNNGNSSTQSLLTDTSRSNLNSVEESFNIQRGIQRGELQRSKVPKSTINNKEYNYDNFTLKPSSQPIDIDMSSLKVLRETTDSSWLTGIANLPDQRLNDQCKTLIKTRPADLDDERVSPLMSNATKNLIMEQPRTGLNNLPTLSVHLLKHIANQSREDDDLVQGPDALINEESIYEPECLLSVSKLPAPRLLEPVRFEQESYVVSSESTLDKPSSRQLMTTKQRLYIPVDVEYVKKESTPDEFDLRGITIEKDQTRQLVLSDQHYILECMADEAQCVERRKACMVAEPDDIFVNRSKRVVSKIDADIERRKRIRFERISQRQFEGVTNASTDEINSPFIVAGQDVPIAEVVEEDDGSEYDEPISYDGFVPIQLPLEEPLTEAKKHHVSSLGLIARYEKNKMMIEEAERKFDLFNQLDSADIDDDLVDEARRFVDMVVKTGGGLDTQLRTESSIKRCDLPLIEGLNRNTSRVKMTYMSILGLDKRSKRTTLYKVKPIENFTQMLTQQASQSQLLHQNQQQAQQLLLQQQQTQQQHRQFQLQLQSQNQRVKPPDLNNIKATLEIVDRPPACRGPLVIRQPGRPLANGQQYLQAAIMSCREALKLPNKDEYMRSLGLIDITS